MEGAPVDANLRNVAAPAVEDVVFELALVDEVHALSADTLEFTISVNLSEARLDVVFTDSKVVVNGSH